MTPTGIGAPFFNRPSLARVHVLVTNVETDTGRLSRIAKTRTRGRISRQGKPKSAHRKLLFRLLMRSHQNRHHVRELASRHSGAHELQLLSATEPDRPQSSTIPEPDASLLHDVHILDGIVGAKHRGSARNAQDPQPGGSRRRLSLSNLREVSTPERGHGMGENVEDQPGTNRYAFTPSFLWHLVAKYTTPGTLHGRRRIR